MKNSVLRRVSKYIKRYSLTLLCGITAAILYVLFTLSGPVFIGRAIDYCIGAGKVDFAGVKQYLILLLLSVVLAGIAQWTMQVATRSVSAKVSRDMRIDAFKSINKTPLATLDTHSHGDIISRLVNDADAVGEGVLHGLTQGLPGVATIIGTLIVMLWQSPVIALLVVLITPLSILFARFIARRTAHLFRKQAEAQGELSGLVNEMLGGAEVVRAFSYQDKAFARFDDISDKLFSSGLKSVFYSSITNPGTRFVNSIVYAAVLVAGAMFVLAGRMSVGQLSCFLTYANHYTKPFNEITGVMTQFEAAIAGARRLLEVMDYPQETELATYSQQLTSIKGNVKIDKVYFAYNPSQPLIRDFNLSVKAGERIAIVGATGCGKTTLINLLMRFYEVNSGSISVDGVDISCIQRAQLRSAFGMVLQDTWLKNATVRDNIAYGKPNATDEEIRTAARESYAHSFIKRLPQGYDTVITQGGGNLSAGQKQLLCIARIMLCRPNILILDEATSSIDTRTELLVQCAFLKLMENRTSFVVAHRLSTIAAADCILFMRDGQIIERGTHIELLNKKGFYYTLYNSQFDI